MKINISCKRISISSYCAEMWPSNSWFLCCPALCTSRIMLVTANVPPVTFNAMLKSEAGTFRLTNIWLSQSSCILRWFHPFPSFWIVDFLEISLQQEQYQYQADSWKRNVLFDFSQHLTFCANASVSAGVHFRMYILFPPSPTEYAGWYLRKHSSDIKWSIGD